MREVSTVWKLVPVVLLVFVAACAPGPGTPPATTPASTASSTTAPATTAELITVPDVSGLNHQDAQNRMQAAGLYNLREVDGTGQGRALVLDRNWVQVAQDPPAGSKVPKDTVITLTAIKYTDR
ncbi:hypothetical protein FNH06_36210 [Amycolatopsis acidiphila]|uniref:PASTA domain-containing protein n=1 Tax=Amycolatopsis acidiphila TaxID=715473 RepID=A0A557ZTX3_9PSEU|nr:hypothetical protein FNH06_36210 [Amycolatopsis acidiphila]